jgi:hypothetical protein
MHLKNNLLGIQCHFAAGSQNNTTPQFRISSQRYIIGAGDHYSGSDTEPTKAETGLFDVFHNVTIPMYVYIGMFTWFLSNVIRSA